jgi:hypothetical protein
MTRQEQFAIDVRRYQETYNCPITTAADRVSERYQAWFPGWPGRPNPGAQEASPDLAAVPVLPYIPGSQNGPQARP